MSLLKKKVKKTKKKKASPKSFSEFLYGPENVDAHADEQIAIAELFAENSSPCTRCFIDEDLDR